MIMFDVEGLEQLAWAASTSAKARNVPPPDGSTGSGISDWSAFADPGAWAFEQYIFISSINQLVPCRKLDRAISELPYYFVPELSGPDGDELKEAHFDVAACDASRVDEYSRGKFEVHANLERAHAEYAFPFTTMVIPGMLGPRASVKGALDTRYLAHHLFVKSGAPWRFDARAPHSQTRWRHTAHSQHVADAVAKAAVWNGIERREAEGAQGTDDVAVDRPPYGELFFVWMPERLTTEEFLRAISRTLARTHQGYEAALSSGAASGPESALHEDGAGADRGALAGGSRGWRRDPKTFFYGGPLERWMGRSMMNFPTLSIAKTERVLEWVPVPMISARGPSRQRGEAAADEPAEPADSAAGVAARAEARLSEMTHEGRRLTEKGGWLVDVVRWWELSKEGREGLSVGARQQGYFLPRRAQEMLRTVLQE
jgi:nucleoside-diphosphate-sugar epimerase